MVYTMRRHQLGFRLVEHQWVRPNPERIVYCNTCEAQSAHSYSVCEDNLFQLVVDYAFNGGRGRWQVKETCSTRAYNAFAFDTISL